jgi:anti-sigma factor RsiW
MTFLAGLAATIGEWLLSKLFAVLSLDYKQWAAARKSSAALAANQAALQTAEKSGNEQTVENAGANSLDNSGGS